MLAGNKETSSRVVLTILIRIAIIIIVKHDNLFSPFSGLSVIIIIILIIIIIINIINIIIPIILIIITAVPQISSALFIIITILRISVAIT